MEKQYLQNIEAPVMAVKHADLQLLYPEDSIFKAKCPACEDGILLVQREQKTLRLAEHDRCITCGQAIRYTDITELRAKEGDTK